MRERLTKDGCRTVLVGKWGERQHDMSYWYPTVKKEPLISDVALAMVTGLSDVACYSNSYSSPFNKEIILLQANRAK